MWSALSGFAMERIYLHIGTHKTGTTSIQQFLTRNRHLLAQQGYCYPVTKSGADAFVHHTFTASLDTYLAARKQGSELADSEFLRVARDSGLKRLVLSSENLSWVSQPEEIIRLYTVLSKLAEDVRVICCIRRQDRAAVSHHQQGVGNGGYAYRYYGGGANPFPAPDQHPWNYLDHFSRYQSWAQVLGPQQLDWRVFEPQQLVSNNLISDFCHALQLDPDVDYASVEGKNPSMSAPAQRLLEQLDGELPYFLDGKISPQRRQLSALVRSQGVAMARQLATESAVTLLPARGAAEAFYARFADSNEALRLACFGARDTVFDKDFSDYPDVDTRLSLGLEQVADLQARVLKKLLNQA